MQQVKSGGSMKWLEITSDKDSEGVLLAMSAISEIRKDDGHAVFAMNNGHVYHVHTMKYEDATAAYKREAQC